MFSFYSLLTVGLVALIVGCIGGILLSRLLSPQQQKARSLEAQLQDTEKKLIDYQQEVTEHFAQTAKLVNTLTQSYRDVHEHLANDALKLANVDISRQLLSSAEKENGLLGNAALDDENFQPPRDWAPKRAGAKGALSEGYDIDVDDDVLSVTTTDLTK